ncbi:MAG: hypothetical protein FWH12_09165 [Treponema sp.]|nr:hypothetical protein [Treponema sp.]
MKKFLLVLFLLAVLAGAVFFLGWAQLTVPPGSYGVMRSKTHGLDAQVISDEEFRWIWYKVIPTNTEVTVFNLDPVRHPIRRSGSLSSGQVYAELASLEIDFTWEITGELRYGLKPQMLPDLVGRGHIRDEQGLRLLEADLGRRLEVLVVQRLVSIFDRGDEERIRNLLFTGTLPELDRDILGMFPELEYLTTTIQVARLPDYEMYRSVRTLYQEYLARLNEILHPSISADAERRMDSRFRLEELARYGEILTQYPILIQLLALERNYLPLSDPPLFEAFFDE